MCSSLGKLLLCLGLATNQGDFLKIKKTEFNPALFLPCVQCFVPGSGVRDWTQSTHQGEIIPNFLEMLQLKLRDSEWRACRQTVGDGEQWAKILFLLKSDDVRPLLFVGKQAALLSSQAG